VLTLTALPSPITDSSLLPRATLHPLANSAHGNKKRLMTLTVDEFLRRFLLHLLPRGFVRIPPLRLPRQSPPCQTPTTVRPVAETHRCQWRWQACTKPAP